MNGTDNNDAEIPGLTLPQPGLTSLNPDAVREFRVMTSNFLPEFGRNTGAIVDIITKRGTNDFHSDLYWFGRYDALGARDYFNHQINATGHLVPKDSYVRNIFAVLQAVPSCETRHSGSRTTRGSALSRPSRTPVPCPLLNLNAGSSRLMVNR